jgi:hypothetical protein
LAARQGRSEVVAIVATLLLLLGVAAAAFMGGHKYGPHWGTGDVEDSPSYCSDRYSIYCDY